MLRQFHAYDKIELKKSITGSARRLLIDNGVPSEVLDGKHHPCPKCGGKDRFRAIDIDQGVLFCNQCFNEKNGDIFSALQWWLNCSFEEALKITGQYLNNPPSLAAMIRKTEQKSVPFTDQVEFLGPDQQKLNSWAKSKPPLTGKAADAASARLCIWPKKAPHNKQLECVAFPAFQGPDKPSGWILYRLNGEDFPTIENGPGQRKTHLLRGSADGWVFPGGRSSAESAHTIIKVEGIPDALALYAWLPEGSAVVTNTHGAKSAKNCPTDIFSGKRVIVIGDNDRPGIEGANSLAHEISPYASEVKVAFPDGEITESKGKDIRDLMIENQQARIDPQATVDALLQKAEKSETIQIPTDEPLQEDNSKDDGPEGYKPFPIECLPSVMKEYVKAGSNSLKCDSAYITLPLLVVSASLIGASRVLRPSNDWKVPPTLWAVVIAYSGSMKTPAMKLALDPVYKLQEKAHVRNRDMIESYETRKAIYDTRMKDYIKELAKADGPPPDEPEKPDEPRIIDKIAGDVTFERLAYMIKHNPKGILLSKDELSGLIGSLNKYSGSKGSDEAVLLEGYNLGIIQVHRKHDPRDIFVPNASICINGNTQPEIYKRIMNGSYRESGFMARFLKAYPPRTVKQYPGEGVPDDVKAALMTTVESLDQLQPMESEEGVFEPASIFLTAAAKTAYKQFHHWHNTEAVTMTGDLPAEWSKLEEIPLRLALIFHCVECVTTGQISERVSAETMLNAIQVTEWFKKESLRVYRLFDQETGVESAHQQETQRLIKFIRDKGGRVGVRDTQRGLGFKTADETEKALERLVKSDAAEWVDIPTKKKGQPARGISLRHTRLLTSSQESSGLAADVSENGGSDDFFTEPEPKKILKREPESEVPEGLGDYLDFLGDKTPF